MTHIWFPTLFPRGIIIFQGVRTKFNFSTKFPHLEKIINLMKCQFLRIWWKKFILAGVLRINIWFSVPIPKINFEPLPQGKSALVFIF